MIKNAMIKQEKIAQRSLVEKIWEYELMSEAWMGVSERLSEMNTIKMWQKGIIDMNVMQIT